MHNMIDCTTIYSHMHQVCGFNAHCYIVPGLQFPTEDCIRCWDCDVQHSFVHTANSVLCHQEGNNCCKWSTKLYYCLNVCICSSVTGPPWGGANRGYFPAAPKLLRGPCGFYFYDFYFYGLDLHAVSLSFALHCLDSMSERLGRIISNGFMVSIDKHFDVRRTPLFY